ncbi:MAG: M48 family metalloprotease [Planctomycetes bacterium]|nr:M48 family metalloprotease [Planctomycetota bacterium]
MFNILGILIALMIASLSRDSGVLVGWESLVAVGAGALVAFAASHGIASQLIDRFELTQYRLKLLQIKGETEPELDLSDLRRKLAAERELLLRRVPLFRHGVDALILGQFIAIAWLFGWADFVTDVLRVPEYLDVLPVLAPYFLMLAASWWGQYRIERRIRGADWRPLRFLGFQARANGMTILPIALIYGVFWAVTRYVPGLDDLRHSFLFLDIALQMGMVIGVSFFIPFAIRMILPGGPLPEGRLRRRLEAYARDNNLRVNQILVWRTGSRMFATAFVIGLVTPFRYVFITDSLLRRMSEDEILAVFAHEMGHVKHRHLWWLLAFILSFTVVLLGLAHGMSMFVAGTNGELIATALLLLYGYHVFGYVSRRFERQADAFAADTTSPELISQVFVKLGMDNPAAMRKSGWRHFSLDRRIREIVMTRAHPEVKRMFTLELVRGLALGVAVTLGAALLLIQPVREDVVTGLATYSLTKFDRARVSNASDEKLDQLRTQTIERSRAMADLSEEYEAVAYWYEGVVEGLSGEYPEGLDQLAALAEKRRGDADSAAAREAGSRQMQNVEATRIAIRKARENGTSFLDEYDAELVRRGLKTPESGS